MRRSAAVVAALLGAMPTGDGATGALRNDRLPGVDLSAIRALKGYSDPRLGIGYARTQRQRRRDRRRGGR